MDVDFRYIPSFLALADEGHFGRAAERMQVSQPALSGQIGRLEDELGALLFDRTSRPIRLTSAGTAFLAEAKVAIHHLGRAVERSRRADRGELGHLTIGATFWAHTAIVPSIVRAFRVRAPDVALTLPTRPPIEQVDALRTEQLDVGMAAFGEWRIDEPSLQAEPLLEQQMVAIVAEDHEFARRAEVSLDELATQPLVTLSIALSAGVFAKQVAIFQERGIAPADIQQVPDPHAAFSLIAGGVGVGLHMASFSNLSPPGVVFVPLGEDAPTATLLLIWRRDDNREFVRIFLDTARRVARSLDPPRIFRERRSEAHQ